MERKTIKKRFSFNLPDEPQNQNIPGNLDFVDNEISTIQESQYETREFPNYHNHNHKDSFGQFFATNRTDNSETKYGKRFDHFFQDGPLTSRT